MIIPMKVVGIGQSSLDHLFIVDSFPERNTKQEVTEWTIAGGGPVATALVSLSRIGIDCNYHGIVGDDKAGEKIICSLQTENINTAGVIKRSGSLSQVAFIAIDTQRGERTIFWQRPSGNPLVPQELSDNYLDEMNFLLLDGLMAEISVYAAKEARKRNIPVMLDAGSVREGMIELAHLCDYVVCSEEFAREFTKSGDTFDAEKAIMHMKSFGAKATTITLGEKGSITLCGDETFYTPAFNIDVVDTTGAGDVFHGGYIYGLLQNWNIHIAVKFASAFAALKCRKIGGRAGIPGLEEVESFMKTHDST